MVSTRRGTVTVPEAARILATGRKKAPTQTLKQKGRVRAVAPTPAASRRGATAKPPGERQCAVGPSGKRNGRFGQKPGKGSGQGRPGVFCPLKSAAPAARARRPAAPRRAPAAAAPTRRSTRERRPPQR